MSRFNDTIAALATPAGTSAIAMVRASGRDALRVAGEIFGDLPPPRSLRRADYREQGGQLLDDVLFTVFVAPHSYTGEDSFEISCHGNPLIAQKILEDLFVRGLRPAEPGEFTQRAFLNGQMDLSQAEAVMDLIHARSERALAAANQQLRGALGRRVAALTEDLLRVIAQVEAYIDFPEEDLPAEDQNALSEALAKLSAELGRLLATSHYGNLLRDGIRTVIVGEPNVGKSSLLNQLVGRERALVSAEPGTTRDFLEERLLIGPHCFRLIDTAGLNRTPGGIEKLGIDKTREQASEADLFLVVVDSSVEAPLPASVRDLVNDDKTIYVANKSDLRSTDELPTALSDKKRVLRISALTGDGISELTREITVLADTLGSHGGDEEIAINSRHANALVSANEGLERALSKLKDHAPTELLASDLRDVLSAIEQIAGRVDNERMLDHLFASFCIGK